MDSTRKHVNVSPERTAGFFSKLFFCWVFPFLRSGIKKDLEEKDVYNTAEPDLSNKLGEVLERCWEDELMRAKTKKKDPSFGRALAMAFYRSYALFGAISFLQCVVLRLIHPLVLAEFIKSFQASTTYTKTESYLLGLGVVIISFVNVMVSHQVTMGTTRTGMRWRIASCSLIYRKLLRLSKTSLNHTTSGQIINLMSNDVQRFEMLAEFMHYIWITPIQAVVGAAVMYKDVGISAVVGVLSIVLQAVLLQGFLSSLMGKYRGKIATRTDNRVKLMSEITSGIQIIKMYAWEKPFEKVVRVMRKLEIDFITKKSYIMGFMIALMVFTERTSLYLAVIAYSLAGNQLTSDIVFSLAQFFNIIQLYMAILFPLGLMSLAEAKVSIRRIQDFLLLSENPRQIFLENLSQKGTIVVSKAKASWLPNPIIDTLSNVNLNIEAGKLYAIVGPVGGGKSSLLKMFLRELPLNNGRMDLAGSVSYASQEPWLFVSSVKNNILFGQSYLRGRYREIIEVCALKRDFELLPHGDKTLVGERGVSLSGGQRARINLARSVYRNADIYLFDDPLSAVDTHVGRHLFEQCIVKYLRGKTRVLVTHQLQYLKDVDQIIIVSNGQIDRVGSYNDLKKELDLLQRGLGNEQAGEKEVAAEDEVAPQQRKQRLMSVVSETSTNEDEILQEPTETQELMEKGSIPTSTYVQYFTSGTSVIVLFVLIILIILAQVVCNSGDLWLKYWTNQEELLCKRNMSDWTSNGNLTDADVNATALLLNETLFENHGILESVSCDAFEHDSGSYIATYSALIVATMVLTIIRSLFFFKVCMNASKSLHNSMFSNILQATMRFFDTNPSGRILNRFSKDIGAVDEILPKNYMDTIQIFMVMSGILTMVFIVSPFMILPTIVLTGLFFGCRYIYMSSAQALKRIEGITKAPVFSHVSATLSGITTIRSSLAENMVSKEFDTLQDQHTGSFFLALYTSETFGFYLDLISTVFLAIVTFQFFIFDEVLGGDVGLVVSQSLILTGMLQYGMRQTTAVATNMTSVERILQYTKLDKEGPFESAPTKKPHRDWPERGRIEFKNVYLQYAPNDPPVLKNLNIIINAGYKVGIVGRTGAGKSSLIAALFRLAPIEGSIIIDGVDTKTIGLNDLRGKISIIPQEPVLFSTTVRNNLDPFDKSDDETLWKALENVELKDAVDKLEQEVSEGGSNFSAGQRQLVCLARAIIRNNKVIILDEATANVDQQTDALIQQTIRKNFEDCTVLTIAHRLNTIMDSDNVIVMDAGEMVEFGHPHKLLEKPEGYFSRMVDQTGEKTADALKSIALNAYERTQNKSTDEITRDT